MMIETKNDEELIEAACKAREKSYSPYSGYKVGSAIQLTNGVIVSGCNVENASYGGTVCAERVAIQNAVAQHGKIEIAAVAVVTDSSPPWSPCGLCRQVLAEFSTSETRVLLSNLQKATLEVSFGELFPLPFHLKTP